MIKTVIIVGALIFVVILIFKFGSKTSDLDLSNKTRPGDSHKPTKLIDNDKLILVRKLKLDYLKKAIIQFCNIYNQEAFIALPRLTMLDNQYVITFPYDIDFERFCYFVNYLENAHELCLLTDYRPEVKAWCSTQMGDAGMTDDIVNKNVMIYIPDWDEEHDNVYLTTQDNLGYKMGFALGEAHQSIDKPTLTYEVNPIDLYNLTEQEYIDYK